MSLLRPGVWLHTSWRVLPDGTRFPSNGLVLREGDHLLLVDTAWGEELTEELLGWIETSLQMPVARAVVTHAHDDRLGGAAALRRRGVSMLGHPLTHRFALEQGVPAPDTLAGLAVPGSAAAVGSVEVFYPGPGHARDNVMVYVPAHRLLFGGCAVRALAATTLGNLADADTAAWTPAIDRVLHRYATAAVVVPGHGAAGGPDLLAHTRSLLAP